MGVYYERKKEVVLMEYSELKKRHFGTNDTDKKLTDEEIISSLELIATTRNCDECKIRNCKWGTCNCSQITANAALDLINRQKEEIEKLKGSTIVSNIMESQRIKREAKAEAYKEFAERLKEKAQIADCFDSYNMVVGTHFIDNLVKEMVGETGD